MGKNSETTVVTPKFRMAFVSILKARKNLRGEDQYEVVMLFPPETDLAPLKAAAKAACVAKWGADETKWPKPLRSPFRKGDEDTYSKYEGFKGQIVVRASTKTPPRRGEPQGSACPRCQGMLFRPVGHRRDQCFRLRYPRQQGCLLRFESCSTP